MKMFLFAILHRFEIVKCSDGKWRILAIHRITGKRKMTKESFYNRKVAQDFLDAGIDECLTWN